jgi:uncharacterized protein YbaR (Trm112 family)
MIIINCPVCKSPLRFLRAPAGNRNSFSCRRCGLFVLSDEVIDDLPQILLKKDAAAKISHALRRAQDTRDSNSEVEFSIDAIDVVVAQPLPRPREQADLLIRWIAENIPGPGEIVRVEPSTHMGIIGAKTPAGFELVVNYLFEEVFVTGTLFQAMKSHGEADVTLSFKGWEHYENLLEGSGKYRKAFMAMKYGESELDKVFNDILKPSVAQAGFGLFRLDEVPHAGLIDDRMRVEIQNSDFLIADLTHANAGAYWEAGYAEGLGKPVIYTCKKQIFDAEKTHFDTNHHLTVLWDEADLSMAGEQLKATIRATLPHFAKMND